MQTKAKSNSVITHEVIEGGAVLFKVKGAGEFTLSPASCSDTVRSKAMLHGLIQRVSDAGAMSRDTTTGLPPSPSIRMAAMKRIADWYNSGATEWAIPRAEGGGGAKGLDAVILAAVVEATGKTHAEVREMIEKGAAGKKITPKAYLAALGEAKLVKPIVDRIRGAAVTEDGDDLLGEMMDEGAGPEGEGEDDAPEGDETPAATF